jgi:hypothetical protein
LQDLPKFTQIWIFGLKIYHLATLIWTTLLSFSVLVIARQTVAECYKQGDQMSLRKKSSVAQPIFGRT